MGSASLVNSGVGEEMMRRGGDKAYELTRRGKAGWHGVSLRRTISPASFSAVGVDDVDDFTLKAAADTAKA